MDYTSGVPRNFVRGGGGGVKKFIGGEREGGSGGGNPRSGGLGAAGIW